MWLAHKRPYYELDDIPTSQSERRLSWLENEANIFVSLLRKHRRAISGSCGVIAYLIGWGAIFLLAAWGKGERFGYEGLYDIDRYAVEATDAWGHRVVKQRMAILLSSMFFEILIAGTVVGAAGVKVAYRGRKRSVILPVTGLIPTLLAWLAVAWSASVFFL